MKVKELIEKLNSFGSELEVVIENVGDHGFERYRMDCVVREVEMPHIFTDEVVKLKTI